MRLDYQSKLLRNCIFLVAIAGSAAFFNCTGEAQETYFDIPGEKNTSLDWRAFPTDDYLCTTDFKMQHQIQTEYIDGGFSSTDDPESRILAIFKSEWKTSRYFELSIDNRTPIEKIADCGQSRAAMKMLQRWINQTGSVSSGPKNELPNHKLIASWQLPFGSLDSIKLSDNKEPKFRDRPSIKFAELHWTSEGFELHQYQELTYSVRCSLQLGPRIVRHVMKLNATTSDSKIVLSSVNEKDKSILITPNGHLSMIAKSLPGAGTFFDACSNMRSSELKDSESNQFNLSQKKDLPKS